MAKDRDMTGYDIMYDGQEAQADLERQAIEIVEDYCKLFNEEINYDY